MLAGGLSAVSAGFYFSGTATDGNLTALASNAAPAMLSLPAVLPPEALLDPTATPATPLQPVTAQGVSLLVQPTTTATEVLPATPSPTVAPPTATPRPPAPTATPVPPLPPAAPVSLNGLEQTMLTAHNSERAAAGFGPLEADATLTRLARQRALDMATRGYFAHTSPTGETAFTLLNGAGYGFTLAGENLARNNYPDAQTVSVAMSGFMSSVSHRVNVLEPTFRRVGIGQVVAADGMKYFVVIFSAP